MNCLLAPVYIHALEIVHVIHYHPCLLSATSSRWEGFFFCHLLQIYELICGISTLRWSQRSLRILVEITIIQVPSSNFQQMNSYFHPVNNEAYCCHNITFSFQGNCISFPSPIPPTSSSLRFLKLRMCHFNLLLLLKFQFWHQFIGNYSFPSDLLLNVLDAFLQNSCAF